MVVAGFLSHLRLQHAPILNILLIRKCFIPVCLKPEHWMDEQSVRQGLIRCLGAHSEVYITRCKG